MLSLNPLITSCSKPINQFEEDTSIIPVPPDLMKNRDFSSDKDALLQEKYTLKLENFEAYPDPEKLKSNVDLGKEDPFIFNNDAVKSGISSNFSFHGIITDGNITYAIVKYTDLSGSLQKDQIGGVTTKLLPEGVKVENIDLENEILILSFNDEIYDIKMNED